MAVVATPTKNVAYMNLNNGSDPQTGQVRTVKESLGTLTPTMSDYSDEKAMAVMEALARCLSKPLYSAERVTTSTLQNQQ